MERNMQGMQHSQMSAEMQACIRNCEECKAVCIETTQHCLQMGGKHAEPAHFRLMMDCAEICQTSANFMLRMSDFHGRTCGVCAEVCRRCAEDCARFGDDEMMQRCAEVCRRCAESCQAMAS